MIWKLLVIINQRKKLRYISLGENFHMITNCNITIIFVQINTTQQNCYIRSYLIITILLQLNMYPVILDVVTVDHTKHTSLVNFGCVDLVCKSTL